MKKIITNILVAVLIIALLAGIVTFIDRVVYLSMVAEMECHKAGYTMGEYTNLFRETVFVCSDYIDVGK